LGIAGSGAGSADGVRGCELTIATAIFVTIVADGIVLKFARGRVAACIGPAAICASAITLLISFYNAVAAGLAAEESDTPVI
jgi:hypothetical protein